MSHHPHGKELLKLDPPARRVIRAGLDPLLALSYIVWPTPRITAAQAQTTRARPKTRATPETSKPQTNDTPQTSRP